MSQMDTPAVIDPLREVQPYIENAAEKCLKIKYVLRRHFSCWFVSGHMDLSGKTGDTPDSLRALQTWKWGFDAIVGAKDGQEFQIGKEQIKSAVHTTGPSPWKVPVSCFYNEEGTGGKSSLGYLIYRRLWKTDLGTGKVIARIDSRYSCRSFIWFACN